MRPPRFRFRGHEYGIHVAWYNKSWRNERQVELPLAFELMDETDSRDTLEVGNVLSHYGRKGHIVVDKYEEHPGTLRVDVVDYSPGRTFKLILSISTLEHVGLDEAQIDPTKFKRAVHHLVGLLTPGGLLWASIPMGYSPYADAFVAQPEAGFEVSFLVRASGRPGDWTDVPSVSPETHPYQRNIPTAGAVAIVRYRASLQ